MEDWTTTAVSTNPSSIDMVEGESLPLTVNVAALVEGGETVSAPSAKLWRVTPPDQADVDDSALLTTAPVLAGATTIRQTVSGLVRDRTYRLVLLFTVAVNKRWGVVLVIRVVA